MATALAKALGVVETVLGDFPAEKRAEILAGLATLNSAFLTDAGTYPPGPLVLYTAMLAAMMGVDLDALLDDWDALHDAIEEKLGSLFIQGHE